MPIRVEYGPASLAGTLAVRAGQAAGRRADVQQGLQQQQIDLQTAVANQRQEDAAMDRAFRLQQAVANREVAAQQKTALAQRIETQATAQRQTTLRKESIAKQKFVAQQEAIQERTEAKTDLDLIRQPFQDNRKILVNRIRELDENIAAAADIGLSSDQVRQLETQQDQANEELNGITTKETQAVRQHRARKAGTLAAETGQALAPMNQANLPRPTPPDAPENRQTGTIYALPNGRVGVWRGTGWEIQ